MASPLENRTAGSRHRLRRALGWAGLALLVWLFGVWPPPVWWRGHWPRCTAMMREHAAGGVACPAYHPAHLSEISPLLPRMVIIGEDSRFRTHHGIDPIEIADALQLDRGMGLPRTVATVWRRRDRLRGASTLTQQLAKNLYLSPSRNPLRKLKEAVIALRLELALPKDRILELYLDLVEWGPGVWGADAASRDYFGVARFHGRDVVIPIEEEVDSIVLPVIEAPVIPPVVDSMLQDTVHVRTDTA